MKFFDFTEEVYRAWREAPDFATRLGAKTAVHRAKFPGAVVKAGFTYLPAGGSFSPGEQDLVIGAAPWSDPDLAALEELAKTRSTPAQVTVFDIDELSFSEMLAVLPGLQLIRNTPVVLQYTRGVLTYFGEGNDAVLWLRQL